MITNAVTQLKANIKEAISSFTTPPMPTTYNDMDTNITPDTNPKPSTLHHDLNDLIIDFKHEIATIVMETCALFHQQATLKTTAKPKQGSTT